MKFKRIIARLDIKNNALVKGIHLEGLRVLGAPRDFAKRYSEEYIDEIIYMDVVASLYGRNGLVDLVQKTAENIFVPLTVGGGIRTLEDVKELLNAGADKVCINTAAVNNPQLIADIADKYGSSTLVVALEVIKIDGKYMIFTDNGREFTGRNAIEWAKEVEELGAGEILLTSVDHEGTLKGFDMDLIDEIKDVINLPIIVHGGMGKIKDAVELFKEHDIDALCASSVFHYEYIKHFSEIESEIMGNKDFIKSKKSTKEGIGIIELKNVLQENGIGVRL